MQSGVDISWDTNFQLPLHGTAQWNTQLCHAVSSCVDKLNFYICSKVLLKKVVFKKILSLFKPKTFKSRFPKQATIEQKQVLHKLSQTAKFLF